MLKMSTLSQLKPDCDGNTKLICVACKLSKPFQTRGPNHVCRAEVIDPSTSDIIVCVLQGFKDFLPKKHLISEPSIIVLTHVKIQYFAGRPQINQGDNFSYAFFNPYEELFEPLDQSGNFIEQLQQEEKSYISGLRDWIVSPEFASTNFGEKFSSKDPVMIAREVDTSSLRKRECAIENDIDKFQQITNKRPKNAVNKFKDFPISLDSICEGLYFNLRAQMVGKGNGKSSYIVRCCDGTIPPIKTLKIPCKLVDSNISQQQLLQIDAYTVDVNIFDNHVNTAKSLKLGDFVLIRNVHCYTPFGLFSPELILHGGNQFGRGIVKIEAGSVTARQLTVTLNKVPIEAVQEIVRELPADVARCVQTSPTECLYPEQSITNLARIAENPRHKVLYKVRVFVHCHTPDSFPAMFCLVCNNCSEALEDNVEQCTSCNNSLISKIPCFKLLVQDKTVSEPVEVSCLKSQVSAFLSIDRVDTPSDLVLLDQVIGKWCDLHILSFVLSDKSHELTLSHTIIKKKW